MAIAPLVVAVRTTGAAALTRTAAQLRAFGTAVRSTAVRTATAARTTSTYTGALGRLAAALRRVALAALIAARAIGGSLVRAMRRAADAAFNLIRTLALAAARMAAIWGPVVGAVIAVLPAVVALSAGVMLLAPAVIAAAAAFGTFKLATAGFMDALKADAGEDLDKALGKLTWAARETVLTLRDLGREWKSTQQKVQETFFRGARADFIMISRAIQSVADKWLPKLAKSFADARQWIAMVIAAAADTGQLDTIMEGVHRFLTGLLTSVPYLLQAFLDIAEVAAPSFGDIGDSISDAAKRFADWIRELRDNGTLKKWLDDAKETFNQVKDVVKEVGRVFAAIFQGAEGNNFLENLRDSLSDLADWLESDNGQAVIHFFIDVAEAAAHLITTIAAVVNWFRDGFNELREIGRGLRDSLGAAFGAIGAAAGMLFGILAGGVNAFGWIGGVIGRMGQLVGAIQNAVGYINAALSAIRTNVVIDIITRHTTVQGYAKPITSGGGGGSVKYYASGTRSATPGFAVVGEHGPELVRMRGGEQVYSANATARMGRSSAGGNYGLQAMPGGDSGVAGFIAYLIRRNLIKLKVVNGQVVVA